MLKENEGREVSKRREVRRMKAASEIRVKSLSL